LSGVQVDRGEMDRPQSAAGAATAAWHAAATVSCSNGTYGGGRWRRSVRLPDRIWAACHHRLRRWTGRWPHDFGTSSWYAAAGGVAVAALGRGELSGIGCGGNGVERCSTRP